MVMDLNKCIGCHTCTSACKTQWTNRNGREYMYWNNVETKPGDGYPRYYEASGGGFDENGQLKMGKLPSAEDYGEPWEYNYEEALMTGTDPWLRPNVKPTWGPNWDEDEGEGLYPNSYHFYLPRICNHCTNPACLAACSRNAIYKRQEDGIVLIDQERCRGYRYCVTACPYKKVYFNEQVSKSEKCIFCYPRIEKGLPTACAQQCVGRIRWIGYRDDEDGPIHTLVDKYRVALPLHAEWGTQPNVFYSAGHPGIGACEEEGGQGIRTDGYPDRLQTQRYVQVGVSHEYTRRSCRKPFAIVPAAGPGIHPPGGGLPPCTGR
jgi:dimethylsulfide dehydrogenase subunit beta/complex iron-sulfur molybdoenzyme family reductase subunit beta